MRNVGLDSPLFATPLSRGGFASNPVHFRAYREESVHAAFVPEASDSATTFNSVDDFVIDLPVQ